MSDKRKDTTAYRTPYPKVGRLLSEIYIRKRKRADERQYSM